MEEKPTETKPKFSFNNLHMGVHHLYLVQQSVLKQ